MGAYGLTCLLLLCVVEVFSKPTYKNERVHLDPELSRDPHEDNQSYRYDHEAFLGKEEATTFDQLTPEESKERLGKIVDRIDGDKDGYVTTDELKSWTNPEEFQDATDQFSFKKMLPRDERRFKTADLDGDTAASREEFTAFLHPEEFDHMKDIVVLETLEDIDKNGDGHVDEDEYIVKC
ncbi:UNVERIFIED_CONTAM: hypothetical protein FKN15_037558 [Acipenser sinensis]